MKTRLFTYSLLFMIVCVMTISCSSKSEVFTDNAESQELYRIQVGGKCGFINEKGKLVIEPQFDRAYWYFSDNVCFAELGERKGLIDVDGKFVAELDASINWVRQFRKGVATFRANNGKEGIVNKSGEILLPATFKEVFYDENNGFLVEDTLGNYGYVNYQGDIILPCQNKVVRTFNEGLMVVGNKNNKYGYVDTKGAWAIDTIYDDARDFGNGLARVKVDEKWHFIEHNGNVVSRFNYDDILTGFSCNRAFVKNGNAIEMIDSDGKKIAIVEADSVFGFSEGFATFKKNGKYGKIDIDGNVVIQPLFENLLSTNNGLSVFIKNNKQGVVDTVGNVIVDAIHEEMFHCDGFSLLCFEDDNWSKGTYYDCKGQLIWKDMDNGRQLPNKPTKEDWKSFFDAKLADLDPIEGLYYVEYTNTYQNRTNPSIVGSNGGGAMFWAITRKSSTNSFVVHFVEDKPNMVWMKKFEKIGDSNKYAIIDYDTTWPKFADNSSFVMEDPYAFEFQLEQSHNSNYNFYVNYTFTQDYPSSSVFEQVQQPEWTGTGFAIADGYVATNYHVTNGAKTIMVRGINGDMKEAYKGFVVASDREHDLAIIKIVDKEFDAFEIIPYCIGKSIPEVGDEVFVLGFPMTNTMGQEVKLTDGIISAASGFKGDQSMYQISAAVQPGNSGGPLFDNEGNVIGIVCAKHSDAENANYAIKVSYLYSLVNSSGLGIKMADGNKVKSKSLSQKVKQVKPFVYLVECYSH